MQTQIVPHSAGAPTSPQQSGFHPGQRVRLKEELMATSIVYFVSHRDGVDRQFELECKTIFPELRGVLIVDAVQVLCVPVPDLVSAGAKDCWFKLHFRSGAVLQHDYFSAWQFEPVQ